MPETLVRTFTARAFTQGHLRLAKPVLGNPATVHYFPQGLPTEEECCQLAKSKPMPMTAFVAPLGDAVNGHFTIRFFTPEGRPFPLCGHATMVSMMHLHQLFGLQKAQFNLLDLRDADTVILEAKIEGDFVEIWLPAYPPLPFLHEDLPQLMEALSLPYAQVVQLQRCNRLHDLVLQVADASVVRRLKPKMPTLAKWLQLFGLRGLFVTAVSLEAEVDFEVRIFAPHLGIDEDISCGSANCSLLPFWRSQLTEAPAEVLTVLCPYNQADLQFGGLELVRYLPQDAQVRVGGYVLEDAYA